MNYFLLLIILLLGGGGYYEYTQLQTQIANDEQKIAETTAAMDKLKSDNEKLVKESEAAKSSFELQKQIAPSPDDNGAPTTDPAALLVLHQQVTQGTVSIKGDKATGAGFLVKTDEGPAVITNLLLLTDNPNWKMMDANNNALVVTAIKGASDRDVAKISIQDGAFSFMPISSNAQTVVSGDDVVMPSVKPGACIDGKDNAVAPDRINFTRAFENAPGGPVMHAKSSSVVGVVTHAAPLVTADVDKTTFGQRSGTARDNSPFFGLRVDNVPKWETYDPAKLQEQIVFLNDFHQQSLLLDSFISGTKKDRSASARLWLSDEKLVNALRTFQAMAKNGSDGQIQSSMHDLGFTLSAQAEKNLLPIQDPANFYGFIQLRARDELAYRKALKTQVDELVNDVSRAPVILKM